MFPYQAVGLEADGAARRDARRPLTGPLLRGGCLSDGPDHLTIDAFAVATGTGEDVPATAIAAL
jgi:hypothetical protein